MAISPADLELRQKAISEGKLTYTRSNGVRYDIRNLDNPRHQNNFGGQGGRDETSGARKGNRGSGTGSRRQRNETLSTPPWADRRAFGDAMAEANAVGKEGHHNTPVYLTGNALADMSPSRQMQYHTRFRKAGVDIGNQAGNVNPLDPIPHDDAHREGDAVQNWLKIKDGKVTITPIMTKANIPALGGFQQTEVAPYVTPQRPEQPAQKPPQQSYTPPEKPLEPKQDLTQQLYEASETAVNGLATAAVVGGAVATKGLQAVMGLIRFGTGGGF